MGSSTGRCRCGAGAGAVRRARRGDGGDRAQRSGVRARRRLGHGARGRARRRPAAARRRARDRGPPAARPALCAAADPGGARLAAAGMEPSLRRRACSRPVCVLYAAWPPLLAAAALARTRRAAAEPAGRRRPRVRVRDEHRRAGRRLGGGLRPARPGVPAVPAQPPAHRRRRRRVARPRPGRVSRSARHGRRGSPRSPSPGWARLARAPPASPRPCSSPAVAALVLFGARRRRMAATAASSPTTRPTARCGPARSPRWRWSRGGRRVGAGPHAAHASALARLVVDLGASPRPAACGAARDDARRPVARARARASTARLDRRRRARRDRVRRRPIARSRASSAGDRGVSAIVHRRGLLDDPALTAEIARAARLALEHERLHATRRAPSRRAAHVTGAHRRDGRRASVAGSSTTCTTAPSSGS